jgi:hypothetical protein
VKNKRGLEPGLVREMLEDPAALAGGKAELGNVSLGYKSRGRWKGEPRKKWYDGVWAGMTGAVLWAWFLECKNKQTKNHPKHGRNYRQN